MKEVLITSILELPTEASSINAMQHLIGQKLSATSAFAKGLKKDSKIIIDASGELPSGLSIPDGSSLSQTEFANRTLVVTKVISKENRIEVGVRGRDLTWDTETKGGSTPPLESFF